MKGRNKKWIYGAIDVFGYGTGLSLGLNFANILRYIWKYGDASVSHTWLGIATHKPSLAFEIAASIGFAGFCVYKCINGIIKREKRIKD